MLKAQSSLIGRRSGMLVIIDMVGKRRALCRCDCGAEIILHSANVRETNTRSCGCSRYKWVGDKNATAARDNKPEHRSWSMMKNRCLNPNARNWKYYGGRGISICIEWQKSFDVFFADMGKRPTLKHSIDRIDVNGDYCPDNCRWATAREQAANKRPRRDRTPAGAGVVNAASIALFEAAIAA